MADRERSFVQLKPRALDELVDAHGLAFTARLVLIDLTLRADWQEPHGYRCTGEGYAAHLRMTWRRLTAALDELVRAGLVTVELPRGHAGRIVVVAYDRLVRGGSPAPAESQERSRDSDAGSRDPAGASRGIARATCGNGARHEDVDARPPSRAQVLGMVDGYRFGPDALRADLERLGADERLIVEALTHLPPAVAS